MAQDKDNVSSHRTPYRVIYADTDAMGIAYYASYLRWFEIGRTEMLRAWGLAYSQIEALGIMLPVAEVRCKYIQPARYDNHLLIEAKPDLSYKSGLKIDYRILAQDMDRVHAAGFTRHACQNKEGHVVRPPAFLKELIRRNPIDYGDRP